MAFYDWNAEPLIPHADVYDANGSRIIRVTRCDTETGELRILETDIDPYTGIPHEVIDRRPAPLLVVFDKEPSRGQTQKSS